MTLGLKFLCCAVMLFSCSRGIGAASLAKVAVNASGKETISAQEFDKSIASCKDYIQTEDRFASLYEDHKERQIPFFIVRIQKPGAPMPHYGLAYRFEEHFSKRRTNPFTNEIITEDDVSYFRAEAGSKDFVKICTLRELLSEDAHSQNSWRKQLSASAQALDGQSNSQVVLVETAKKKIEPSAPDRNLMPLRAVSGTARTAEHHARSSQPDERNSQERQPAARLVRLMRNIPVAKLLIPYTLIGLVHGATNSLFAAGEPNHNFWWAPWTESLTHIFFWLVSLNNVQGNPSVWRKNDAYKWAWLNLFYGVAQMLGESMPRVPYTNIPAFTLSGTWRNVAVNRSLAMIPLHLWRGR